MSHLEINLDSATTMANRYRDEGAALAGTVDDVPSEVDAGPAIELVQNVLAAVKEDAVDLQRLGSAMATIIDLIVANSAVTDEAVETLFRTHLEFRRAGD